MADAAGPIPAPAAAAGLAYTFWNDGIRSFVNGAFTVDGSRGTRLATHERTVASIATTIALIPHCGPRDLDWDGIAATLADGDRIVLPGRSARSVLGVHWDWYVNGPAGLHVNLRGHYSPGLPGTPASFAAGWARRVRPPRWGTAAYPAEIAEIAASGRVTRWTGTADELVAVILDDPLAVGLEVWAQIVGVGTPSDADEAEVVDVETVRAELDAAGMLSAGPREYLRGWDMYWEYLAPLLRRPPGWHRCGRRMVIIGRSSGYTGSESFPELGCEHCDRHAVVARWRDGRWRFGS
jgi:hypothetical protein